MNEEFSRVGRMIATLEIIALSMPVAPFESGSIVTSSRSLFLFSG
jgi:hypothetical protein